MKSLRYIFSLIIWMIPYFLMSQSYDAIIISICKKCDIIQNGKTYNYSKQEKPRLKLFRGDEIIISEDVEIGIQVTSNNTRILKETNNEAIVLKIIDTDSIDDPSEEIHSYYFQSAAKSRSDQLESVEPPDGATVLCKDTLMLCWGDISAPSIKIVNQQLEEIWVQDIKGSSSIRIVPDLIGLKPGETYFWKLEGIGAYFVINILDEKIENLLE